jgi:alpha-galactosidase
LGKRFTDIRTSCDRIEVEEKGVGMKITFVGGGSLVWGTMLLTDLALTRPLHGATIILQDVDRAALDLMAGMARKISEQAGARFRIEASTELDAAVSGASFVLDSVGVGGLEAMRADLEIPARYGVAQPVGCNVGPGGINRALRHIPHILRVCRTMETACPDAWLLILTNPLTQLTRAATRESGIKTIGLCHEMLHSRYRIAQGLGVAPESLWFRTGGINHLPWITEMRIGDQDGFTFLRKWLAEHGALRYAKEGLLNTCDSVFEDRHAVKFSLFEAYGVLAGGGDRHVAEFYPHFIRRETNWGLDYGVELTTVEHRLERHARERNRLLRCLRGEEPLPLEHSIEEVAELVAALSGGPAGRFIVNLPNQGQIPNLPTGAVVEGYAGIDGWGVHPEFIGPLPHGPTEVCLSHLAEQELTVDAGIRGDRHTALQALLMDPAIQTWSSAGPMLEEMLKATAAFLPQFR